jgi:hypothetical protein
MTETTITDTIDLAPNVPRYAPFTRKGIHGKTYPKRRVYHSVHVVSWREHVKLSADERRKGGKPYKAVPRSASFYSQDDAKAFKLELQKQSSISQVASWAQRTELNSWDYMTPGEREAYVSKQEAEIAERNREREIRETLRRAAIADAKARIALIDVPEGVVLTWLEEDEVFVQVDHVTDVLIANGVTVEMPEVIERGEARIHEKPCRASITTSSRMQAGDLYAFGLALQVAQKIMEAINAVDLPWSAW